MPRGRPFRQLDRDAITEALRETGSTRAAARKLGLHRNTLTRYLKRAPVEPSILVERAPPSPPPPTRPRVSGRLDVAGTRDFVVAAFAEAVEGLDGYTRSSLLRDLSIDVGNLLNLYRGRVQREATSVTERVRRRDYVTASKELSVMPPKPGRLLDAATLKTAKQNFRKAARAYHPDANGGSEEPQEAAGG
jgi:hypothetical protein